MKPYSLNRKAEAYEQTYDLEQTPVSKPVRRYFKKAVRSFWKRKLRKSEDK